MLSTDYSTVSSVTLNKKENKPVSKIKSVLTADGIIDSDYDDGRDDDAATAVCPTHEDDADNYDDCLINSISACSLDDGNQKQFEEAFASFLYKNPAFSSMSYITLTRLRKKLLKQSTKNITAEAELRMQLEQLKESHRRTELMLQKELLAASALQAARNAELMALIDEVRDGKDDVGRHQNHSSLLMTSLTGSVDYPSYASFSPMETRRQKSYLQTPYEGENYVEGIRQSKMEQAHMIAEEVKIKKEKMKRVIPSILSETIELQMQRGVECD